MRPQNDTWIASLMKYITLTLLVIVSCKWKLSTKIHYLSGEVSSVYWAFITKEKWKKYSSQPLVKAVLFRWMHLLENI